MSKSVFEKILSSHIVDGNGEIGKPISVKIDQTLTQDATGTMVYLEFEAMGLERVKTELSVSYVDHNMTMIGPENHNDHLYLQQISRKIGAYHSRPGNGICHQLHLERFAIPGKTLIGSDSHTPTAGGIGAIAMGAGGLDVALAMAGKPFTITMPKIIGVELKGKLNNFVSAKDVILHVLSIFGVKGNVGCVIEYFGEGVKNLSVPERATITNMGAELGITTSIFPSDEKTKEFLELQNREDSFVEIKADKDVKYFKTIEIDLSKIEPSLATPSSPGNISKASELEGKKINQIIVGSCTNSSFRDLVIVSKILKGEKIHPSVEFSIAPGSRQVLQMLTENGALSDLISAGAKILEVGCGPCIGQGQSPGDDTITLRTFNRNFAGRSGTKGDQSYLCSPELATVSAITGKITNPAGNKNPVLSKNINFDLPSEFLIDDTMIQDPMTEKEAKQFEIKRGKTIGSPPKNTPMPENINAKIAIITGDNTTTDHIMPAGQFLKFRSNIPVYADFVFHFVDEDFVNRAKEIQNSGKTGIIISGESFGQGSSREHAAICPAYLGVRIIIAKSIERICKANLINFGLVPFEFENKSDYEKISQNDEIEILNIKNLLDKKEKVIMKNKTKNIDIVLKYDLTDEDIKNILAGGILNRS